MTDYRAVLTVAALRSLDAVPPRIADPLVAFIFGSLASDPRRRGKPLQREVEGRWAARRGDYRIIYRLDDDTKTTYVLRMAYRADAYRPNVTDSTGTNRDGVVGRTGRVT